MPFIGNPKIRTLTAGLVGLLLLCSLSLEAQKQPDVARQAAVLWTDPGDIKSKDMKNGPGGADGAPRLPVKFVEEDLDGHNSKINVEDANGKKWKAKMGIEAQPEVVAVRLMWAIGYFANENYFVRDLDVKGLPSKLRRGQGHVTSPEHLDYARLQRHTPGEKSGQWAWSKNPFVGKREFNGLRVMMALLGNWDMKNDNNAIYITKDGAQHYLVTDLGTSFGASGDRWTEAPSKNNLQAYQGTEFITHKSEKHVSFSFPRFPPFLYIFNLPHFLHQVSLRKIGNNIPREDAKWVGSLLAQLSTEQIEDAFRAAGYGPDEVQDFTKAVLSRIAELNQL